jgi:uncharacterized protein YciI
MSVYTMTSLRGPGWDPTRSRREQPGWDDHATFMNKLVDDGFVILGGPIGDGENAMLAIEAHDEREIEQRFTADPWMINGVLRFGKIEQWTIWLDSRQSTSTPE